MINFPSQDPLTDAVNTTYRTPYTLAHRVGGTIHEDKRYGIDGDNMVRIPDFQLNGLEN